MTNEQNKILALALGNDIMGDDAAGLVAARELKKIFGGLIDVFELASAGFGLLDILEGYRKVLILDSIFAPGNIPVKIKELDKNSFSKHISWSPHYAGLPELIELADKLQINFPEEIKVLVLEIHETGILREGLSTEIQEQIPSFVRKAVSILNDWHREEMIFGEHIHQALI
jgi:hydrogenase maturation protease